MDMVEIDTTADELPKLTAGAMALGHLARAVERRCPGVLDDWVEGLESEALLSEIVRLRHPREEISIRDARQAALILARHIRLVTLAYLGAKRLRKKGVV
jgi:hypothetical protein